MISKIIKALNDYGMKVSVYDPWAEPKEVMHEYGLEITNTLPTKQFEAMVLGVAHAEFTNLDFKLLLKKDAILYDVKGTLKGDLVDGKL
jgi:UDP-N-acetyl-D-galactosamine dehydrogenase